MQFVAIGQTSSGWPANILDPTAYLNALPELLPQLPAGARTYVSEPGHYDFASLRCVKDLKFGSIFLRESGHAQIGVDVEFKPNEFKHDASLVIRYEEVSVFNLTVDGLEEGARIWPESRRLGDVQLDEILPTSDGCSHEVQMTGGRLTVACRDLHAEWVSVNAVRI